MGMGQIAEVDVKNQTKQTTAHKQTKNKGRKAQKNLRKTQERKLSLKYYKSSCLATGTYFFNSFRRKVWYTFLLRN